MMLFLLAKLLVSDKAEDKSGQSGCFAEADVAAPIPDYCRLPSVRPVKYLLNQM